MKKENFDPVQKIKEVTEIYNRAGIKEVVKAKIDTYLEKAVWLYRRLMYRKSVKSVFMK